MRLLNEGKIESVEKTEKGYCVNVLLKPWCIECRKSTYKCPHIDGSHGVLGVYMKERPDGNYLRQYDDGSIKISKNGQLK